MGSKSTGQIRVSGNIELIPAKDKDFAFFEVLYRESRDDLRLARNDPDYIEAVIDQQQASRMACYQQTFPNAWHFMVRDQGVPIGHVMLDFGPNEVRLIDIRLIAGARGKGIGGKIIRGLQQAAAMTRAPLALSVDATDTRLKRFYLGLGFVVEASLPLNDFMVWYPDARAMHG